MARRRYQPLDIKKIIAKLPVGYAEEAAGMDGDALRAEIIRAETSIREVEKEQTGDEKLQGAREIVKDIVGSYNDAKRAQRAKIAYSLHLLEERGELGVGDFAEERETREIKPGPARTESAKKKTRAA